MAKSGNALLTLGQMLMGYGQNIGQNRRADTAYKQQRFDAISDRETDRAYQREIMDENRALQAAAAAQAEQRATIDSNVKDMRNGRVFGSFDVTPGSAPAPQADAPDFRLGMANGTKPTRMGLGMTLATLGDTPDFKSKLSQIGYTPEHYDPTRDERIQQKVGEANALMPLELQKIAEQRKPTDFQLRQQGESERHNRAMEAKETAPVIGLGARNWDEYVSRLGTVAGINNSNRAPTEGERTAAAFMPEAQDAYTRLSAMDAPSVLEAIANQKGMLGNVWNTPQGRSLKQAGRQFIRSVVPIKSGKTITDSEADDYFSIYIPMPGDDDKTLADKRRARDLAMQGLQTIAGKPAPVNPWRANDGQ